MTVNLSNCFIFTVLESVLRSLKCLFFFPSAHTNFEEKKRIIEVEKGSKFKRCKISTDPRLGAKNRIKYNRSLRLK